MKRIKNFLITVTFIFGNINISYSQVDTALFGTWVLDSFLVNDTWHKKFYSKKIIFKEDYSLTEYTTWIDNEIDNEINRHYEDRKYYSGMHYMDKCRLGCQEINAWDYKIKDGEIRIRKFKNYMCCGLKCVDKSKSIGIYEMLDNILILKRWKFVFYFHKEKH